VELCRDDRHGTVHRSEFAGPWTLLHILPCRRSVRFHLDGGPRGADLLEGQTPAPERSAGPAHEFKLTLSRLSNQVADFLTIFWAKPVGRVTLSSVPNSAWDRTSSKLCFEFRVSFGANESASGRSCWWRRGTRLRSSGIAGGSCRARCREASGLYNRQAPDKRKTNSCSHVSTPLPDGRRAHVRTARDRSRRVHLPVLMGHSIISSAWDRGRLRNLGPQRGEP
jgi:hypothetical protein